MPAAVVGTAFVRIRALTTGLSKDIDKALQKAIKDADFDKVGKQLSDGITDGVTKNLDKNLQKSIENTDVDGSKVGEKIGKEFAEGADKAIGDNLGKSLTKNLDDLDKVGSNIGKSFADGVGKEINERLDETFDNAGFRGRSGTLGERLAKQLNESFAKAIKDDKKNGIASVVRNTAKDFDTLFSNEGDNFGNTISRVFARAFGRATPNINKTGGRSGSSAAKSFGDRFVQGLKVALARLIPVLTPTIATLVSGITQYVVALGAQVSLLLQAAAGGAVALGGAGAAVGLAILPLIAAFKVQSARLDRFKAAGEAVGKAWKTFGIETQKTLLPALTRSLQATKKLIPVFTLYGAAIGDIVGKNVEYLTSLITGVEGQRRFGEMFKGSTPIVEKFLAIVIDLGDIISNLFIEAIPVATQFSDILVEMFDRWKNLVQVGSDNGTIAATFQDWFDKAKLVFGALGDVFVGILNIIQIGGTAAVPFFENFATWAQEFRDFTESAAGENKIKQIFDDALEVAHAFNALIVEIGERIGAGIFEAGGNEGLIAFLDTLRLEVVPFLDQALRPLIENLGPQLTEFFLAFTEVLTAFGESGGIEVTIQALTLFTQAMTGLLNIPGMDKIAGTLLGIAGAFTVLKLVGIGGIATNIAKFVVAFTSFSTLSGVATAFGAASTAAGGGLAGMAAGLGAVVAPIALVVAILAAIVGAIVLVVIHWDTLMEAFDAVKRFIADPMSRLERLGEILSDLGGFIVDKVADAFTSLPGIIGRALGSLGNVGQGILALLLAPFISLPAAIGIALVKLGPTIFDAFLDLIGLIARNLPGLLLTALQTAFDVAFAGLKVAVRIGILGTLALIFNIPLLILAGLTLLGPRLVDAFTAAFDFVIRMLPGVIGAVLNFFQDLPGRVVGALSSISDTVVEGLGTALPTILNFFQDLPGRIVGALVAAGPVIAEFFTRVIGELGSTITDAFGDFGGVASAIIGDFIDTFGGLPGQIGGVLGEITGLFLDALGEIPGLVLDALGEVPGVFRTALRGLRTVIISALRFALIGFVVSIGAVPFLIFQAITRLGPIIGELFVDAFTAAFGFLAENLPQAASAVFSFFTGLPGRIISANIRLGEILVDAFTAAFDFLVDALPALIEPVLNFFQDLPGNIIGALDALGDGIREAFLTAWSGLTTWLSETAIPGVIDFFTKLPGRIISALSSLHQTLHDTFWNAVDAARTAVSDAIEDIVDFFRNLPGRITEFALAIAGAALGIGSAIINGIISGLSGAAEAIGGAAGTLLDGIGDIVAGIREGLGKAIDEIIPNKIPGVKVEIAGRELTLFPEINLPNNPLKDANFYAKGGIFDTMTPAIIGEAGREVLIPLTRPSRAAQLAEESGLLDVIGQAGRGGTNINASGWTIIAPDPVESGRQLVSRFRSLSFLMGED